MRYKISNLKKKGRYINDTGEPKTNLNSKAENHIQANKNGVNDFGWLVVLV